MRRGKKWLPEVWPFVEHGAHHGSIPMQTIRGAGSDVHEGEARECNRQHWPVPWASYVVDHGVPNLGLPCGAVVGTGLQMP